VADFSKTCAGDQADIAVPIMESFIVSVFYYLYLQCLVNAVGWCGRVRQLSLEFWFVVSVVLGRCNWKFDHYLPVKPLS